MSLLFEELDYVETPLGAISLRKRREPRAENVMVWEVKLDDDFLMSSLFTASEIALADMTLATMSTDNGNIVVGGLGLGYTALAALDNPKVSKVLVIDAMAPVIDWHVRGLVPMGTRLADDTNCQLRKADFFACALNDGAGFDAQEPNRTFDALLLDIDHSPAHVLRDTNARLYTDEGLRTLSRHIKPGGVFGLWSNDPPEPGFMARLETHWEAVRAEQVHFDNPYTGETSACTVYLARRPE